MATINKDRFLGAWWAAFTGDALAMPCRGYTDMALIKDEYGDVCEMLQPKSPHIESNISLIKIPDLKEQYDYIGEKLIFWKRPGTHYHETLQAGENTLPMFLALHLANDFCTNNGYNDEKWFARYHAIMTGKNGYSDLYVPSMHRRYFENLNKGLDPKKNGVQEANISDLTAMFPLLLYYAFNSEKSTDAQFKILKKFVKSEASLNSSVFISKILAYLMNGFDLETVLYEKMKNEMHLALTFPYRRWIKNHSNESVAKQFLGVNGHVEYALPLSIFLALKYKDNLQEALRVNASLGGEPTGRGVVIGALLGAEFKTEKIPAMWAQKLVYFNEINAIGSALYDACCRNIL